VNNDKTPEDLCACIGIDLKQAEFVFNDIQNKRKATRYQHARPVLIKDVSEIMH